MCSIEPEFYIGAGNDLEITNFEGHVSFDLYKESSAIIATCFGLHGQGTGIRFPVRARDFSLLHDVPTGYELSFMSRLRIRGSIHPLPHTSSWHILN
jgi:hypothetical protein